MAGDRCAGVVTRVVIAAVIVYYIVMNNLQIDNILEKLFETYLTNISCQIIDCCPRNRA